MKVDPDNNKINKSLKFSFLDGVFASIMVGFTQEYFVPILLALGAATKHVGLLNAFSNLSASIVQLKSPDLTERLKSRRKIINTFVFLQACMLLPMVIIAFLRQANIYVFIMTVTLFASFGAIAGPPWASLMSDIVNQNKRGEYFGWRNKVLGLVAVIATFLAGLILHWMKKINIYYGFGIILSFAFLFRIVSWYFLTKMHEPHIEHKKENYFTFLDFIARVKENNFARFVFFVSMMSFSVNLVSPFFAVLMIKNLSFSYLQFSLITITATLTSILMMGRWGIHSDKIGNIKIIKFTSHLIGIIPLLWVINRSPVFLFFAQVFAGFAWAGFNLCASNFIYDSVTPQKRTRCIAYFNVLNGTALACGAMIGGFLIQKLPQIFSYRILTLCVISAILRLSVSLFLSPKIREVRVVEEIRSNRLFFSVIGLRPYEKI